MQQEYFKNCTRYAQIRTCPILSNYCTKLTLEKCKTASLSRNGEINLRHCDRGSLRATFAECGDEPGGHKKTGMAFGHPGFYLIYQR